MNLNSFIMHKPISQLDLNRAAYRVIEFSLAFYTNIKKAASSKSCCYTAITKSDLPLHF